MSIRVAIRHKTSYSFDRPVNLSPHQVRLRPAAHSRTPIEAYSLKVEPANHFINWQQDAYGNYVARLVFPEKVRKLVVDVEVIADMTAINAFDFFLEDSAQTFPFTYSKQLRRELAPYLEVRESGTQLKRWLSSVSREEQNTNDFLVALNQRLEREIDYRIRMEPGVQNCAETLSKRSGSCRDSAWLLVQILRHLGLAARFASGYLVQLTADVKSLDGPSGPEADFTDLHAWCEVYLPGAGWVGMDPTSGLFAGEGHIPLACTPDPVSAAPITGATDKCEVEFDFLNSVTRIHEDPRVTKPYSESQWEQIDALGRAVDTMFDDNDLRLTMGGEPTFVSIDDMDGAQWNTDALGADKLKLAKSLLLRLRDRFAPGALLHYGQGKWYPGEELPRWALGCYWRTDGQPLWRNPALLARVDRDYGHDGEQSEAFAQMLAAQLGVDEDCAQPAYEDKLYYLWREQNLPLDLDPQQASLDDELERRRLARLLDRGLDAASGQVLPLAWNDDSDGWQSSAWPMRRGHIVLIPGDSPMGLRLPLDALPQASAEAEQPMLVRDPFAPVAALPTEFPPGLRRIDTSEADDPQIRLREVVRTALCVESRDGRLHVFMPPCEKLEHYLSLLAAVEASAAELKLPVVIEGYEPPRDERLQRLAVTPDPGVIEVNIHPASNWAALVANTEALYEEARQCRLGTEKFGLDGTHGGTGGGNHVTIGALRAEDSPLLRRPDVLRSLITYWQHHPGLSYLFSGQFIGPTSQAPRVDEGRHESLYELETAFAQIPDGEVPQPWLVDRLLRNLLVDLTGNTHRSEFCIDKMYSPDSPTGRLGLLEFRGFEMPPHPRMSLVQMLLLRSLIARFWQSPYHKPLVRWGSELHDRFMLPHYVERDLTEVCAELQAAGHDFRAEWLAPFIEFRFPLHGRIQLGDIQLELHRAIEPWHVLGEEVGSFGTARYVDSSLERVQIRASGLTDGRYVVACNGRRVPLHNTGTHGEYVGGVRYRAWQPPSALHPTIGVHAPLNFDLIDSWNGRSVGGCRYHVSHPGGRSYETFPVNAYEAESRRVNRFTSHGHSIGEYAPGSAAKVPPAESNPEYPYTLDLRRTPS